MSVSHMIMCLNVSVPHISQEAVGVSQRPPLAESLLYIMQQLSAEVVQLQVFLLQVPGEATLQLQQSGVQIVAHITGTQTDNTIVCTLTGCF